MLGLLCHVQVGILVVSCFDETVLGGIGLSCHFALGPLCDKTDVHCAEARYRVDVSVCEFLQALLCGRELSVSA